MALRFVSGAYTDNLHKENQGIFVLLKDHFDKKGENNNCTTHSTTWHISREALTRIKIIETKNI